MIWIDARFKSLHLLLISVVLALETGREGVPVWGRPPSLMHHAQQYLVLKFAPDRL